MRYSCNQRPSPSLVLHFPSKDLGSLATLDGRKRVSLVVTFAEYDKLLAQTPSTQKSSQVVTDRRRGEGFLGGPILFRRRFGLI